VASLRMVQRTGCLISEGTADLSADLRPVRAPEYADHKLDMSRAFGSGAGILCSICGCSSRLHAAISSTCPDGGDFARGPQHIETNFAFCAFAGRRPMVVRRYSPGFCL
jgi:hypothetical protein